MWEFSEKEANMISEALGGGSVSQCAVIIC